MSHVHASAPGKAVLSGEYAVLHGAPAICMAVNNRAIVTITRVEEPWHSVSAPGYSSGEGRFVSNGSAPEWLQGEDDYPLVDVAWRALAPDSDVGLAIELDTRAFFDDKSGAKLGLGSSAALTVALTAALMQSTAVCDEALRIHREFQAGAGSGVDVAASARRNLLRRHDHADAAQDRKTSDPLKCSPTKKHGFQLVEPKRHGSAGAQCQRDYRQ